MPHAPVKGGTIDDEDDDGNSVSARIGAFHREPAKVAGLGEWQITATEI